MANVRRCELVGRIASALARQSATPHLRLENHVDAEPEDVHGVQATSLSEASSSTALGMPLSGAVDTKHQLLPRNDYTPSEVADAVDLLTSQAITGQKSVRVTWKNGTARDVSTAELRQLVDPELVVRISVDCSFADRHDSTPSSRIAGDVVRHTWGFERRGKLTIEGGGLARASSNETLAYLAAQRPGVAAVRRMLAGPIPLLVIIVIVGTGFVIASAITRELSDGSGPDSWSTLRVYKADAVIALMYYLLAWPILGGTRVVEPSVIVQRAWLTPELSTGLLGHLIATVALLAPFIGSAAALLTIL